MNNKFDDNNKYIILICIFIYTYIYISFDIPEFIVTIYKNPIFKVIFLLGLYFFGYENIMFTLFIAVNYIGIGLKIQTQELLK